MAVVFCHALKHCATDGCRFHIIRNTGGKKGQVQQHQYRHAARMLNDTMIMIQRYRSIICIAWDMTKDTLFCVTDYLISACMYFAKDKGPLNSHTHTIMVQETVNRFSG